VTASGKEAMNPSVPLDNKLPGTSDLDEEAIPEVIKRTQTLQDEAESRDDRLRVEEIKAVSRGI
jgi:hypothetical protein